MIVVVLLSATSFATPPLIVLLVLRPSTRTRFFGHWACAGFGGTVTSSFAAALDKGWLYVAAFGVSGLLGLILWWLSRRKRKRSLKALGSKARARLAAMVKNMPTPGPVLRPVPQGAG